MQESYKAKGQHIMMNISICEDEKIFADRLKMQVEKILKKNGKSAVFDVFSDGADFLQCIEEGRNYDIVFLDIQLENSNGMTVAEKLRRLSRTMPIIFVTGIESLAADGYSVNAFDYIVKSSLDDKLERVLNRFLKSTSDVNITVKNDDGRLVVIPAKEIMYAESDGRGSSVHTVSGEIRTAASISRISDLLPSGEFIEIYKSIYVCTAQIKSVSADTLEMSDGKVLPMSRRRKKAVLSAVMNYVRGR
jgi:DNA-binding LytR/AlgR family response regulator